MKTLHELSKAINDNARSKGFWDNDRNTGEMLMLVVSELSEALEADRKDRYCDTSIQVVNGWVKDKDFVPHFKEQVKDSFEDELADAVIRILDLAYSKGIDIEQHIIAKMRYNATRERMHGKKY